MDYLARTSLNKNVVAYIFTHWNYIDDTSESFLPIPKLSAKLHQTTLNYKKDQTLPKIIIKYQWPRWDQRRWLQTLGHHPTKHKSNISITDADLRVGMTHRHRQRRAESCIVYLIHWHRRRFNASKESKEKKEDGHGVDLELSIVPVDRRGRVCYRTTETVTTSWEHERDEHGLMIHDGYGDFREGGRDRIGSYDGEIAEVDKSLNHGRD